MVLILKNFVLKLYYLGHFQRFIVNREIEIKLLMITLQSMFFLCILLIVLMLH